MTTTQKVSQSLQKLLPATLCRRLLNPTCIYIHQRKTIKCKNLAITDAVNCHSLRSFAYPTSQLTTNIRATDVVDRSAVTALFVILKDKM